MMSWKLVGGLALAILGIGVAALVAIQYADRFEPQPTLTASPPPAPPDPPPAAWAFAAPPAVRPPQVGAPVFTTTLAPGAAGPMDSPVASPEPPPYEAVRQQATDQVAMQIRANIAPRVEDCRAAAAGGQDELAPGDYQVDLSFDASGKELARGISALGDPGVRNRQGGDAAAQAVQRARDAFARCVADYQGQALTISAPGRNVDVTVSLRLP